MKAQINGANTKFQQRFTSGATRIAALMLLLMVTLFGSVEHLAASVVPCSRPLSLPGQPIGKGVTALTYVSASSVSLIGMANGRLLKVYGTGGTGQYMYAYPAGSQNFSSAVCGVYPIGQQLFVALESGILLKIQGTGGTGQNMFAINESGGTITGIPGYPYWIGTQKFSSRVNTMFLASGNLIIGLADGRMLKVSGTGGSGQNIVRHHGHFLRFCKLARLQLLTG